MPTSLSNSDSMSAKAETEVGAPPYTPLLFQSIGSKMRNGRGEEKVVEVIHSAELRITKQK